MKYQEIIIKLGEAYFRASAIDAVGTPTKDGGDTLDLILSSVLVQTGLTDPRIVAEAPGLIMRLMTLRIPKELHREGIVVEAFDPPSQTYEALVDLDTYFASKEAP